MKTNEEILEKIYYNDMERRNYMEKDCEIKICNYCGNTVEDDVAVCQCCGTKNK